MPDLWTEKYKFQHRIQGLINGLSEEMAKSLEKALEKVSGKIIALEQKVNRTGSLTFRKKYLTLQKAEIEKVLKSVYADIGSSIKTTSMNLAGATPEIIDKMIKGAGITIKMAVPKLTKETTALWFESSQIQGTFFNDWLAKLESNAVSRVVSETREGLLLHEGTQKVGKRISAALDVGRKSAEGMAHNGLFQAANWAENLYYQKNADSINRVRFVAELDRQTTPLCISLSGKIFPLGDSPVPPLHWKCRSSLAPVFKNEALNDIVNENKIPSRIDTEPRIIKHRDGTTSKVYEKHRVKFIRADTTHNEWMQGMVNSSDPRNVAFAKEALGPTRFKLARSGKLKVDNFYYEGKLRTIKELEALI